MELTNTADVKGWEAVLLNATAKRVEANLLKEQAKALEGEANDLFLTFVTATGCDKVEFDIGTYRMTQTGGKSSLDKDKLKDKLLKAGVSSDVVEQAFKSATKVTKKSYTPVFYPLKKEAE